MSVTIGDFSDFRALHNLSKCAICHRAIRLGSALCSYFMLVDCVIMAEQILLVFGMEATLPRPILCFVYTVQVSGESRIY